MLGRLVRYGADAMMVSTILAGIKHASGLSLDVERISEPNLRGFMRQYLNAGDYLFNAGVSFAQHSNYFRATGTPGHISLFGEDGLHIRQYPGPSESKW